MGYYSDVALVLSAHATAKLFKYTKSKPQNNINTNLINHPEKHLKDSSGAEFFYWESVKWYEDFPEVQWIEKFINSLKQDEYLFIRVGELIDDVEELGTFYSNPFDVRFSRQILFRESHA